MKKIINIITLLIILINIPILYNCGRELTFDYRNYGSDLFTKSSFYETRSFLNFFNSQINSFLDYFTNYNYHDSITNYIDFIVYIDIELSDNATRIETYTNLDNPDEARHSFYDSEVYYHRAYWKDNKVIETSHDILKNVELQPMEREYEIYFRCDAEVYVPYNENFNSAKSNLYLFIGLIIITIFAFIYKTVSYIRANNENKDKWSIELMAFIIFLIVVIEYNIHCSFGYYALIYPVFYIIDFIVFINFYKIILQKIKNKTIKQSSLIINLIKNIKFIYKIGIFVIATLIINLIAIFNFYGSGFSTMVVLIDIIISLYMLKLFIDYKKICETIQEIANGNLSKKVETNTKMFKELTKDINSISDGMANAVEEKLKGERLKTDLITNVSHDLKTPLTSIINYISLMKKENVQDEKMKKYITILDEKSLKLKNLTDDLIEISKITSGNEKLVLEELNIAEMVMQANGEFAEKFSTKNLEIISKIESNNLFIKLDGKKMWRVLENLYTNVYKYSLENTRVYVELNKNENLVNFSMKNISKQELNITPEELMERFVRGDSSRNTEGSGLRIVNSKTSCRVTRRYI